MKHDLLLIGPLHAPTLKYLEENYNTYRYDQAGDKDAFLAAMAPRITAIATQGDYRVGEDILGGLPRAKLLASFGAGYDGIDTEAAARRGVAVTNTPDILSDCVADTVFALILAVVRRVVIYDRYVREGRWESGPAPLTGKVWGEKLGILGLGRIGLEIAERAKGFRMDIAYHNRRPRPDVPYTYYASPVELARNVAILVVMTPGGDDTREIVNRGVIDALGPNGYLINASRGSTVDEAYLIEALRDKRLAGAGLDAYLDSPRVPKELIALDNAVLLPHVGSATKHTRDAMGRVLIENIAAFFANKPLPTPI
ncbi:MAG: 2-hydroxyacid dehydrogenase [Planctomycetota bacterium]|jgi:lactate dehydrogenase-like 2-hydroxyacid dehydrogenase|nr:2-hydroxyacid dehydrogenase [Planctomycetota bacterium]